MDQGQKTEQPTPRRLETARKQGQFPVSREFVSAVVFLCFIWLLTSRASLLLGGATSMMREFLQDSFRVEVTVSTLGRMLTNNTLALLSPLLWAGMGLSLLAILAHVMTTGLAFSPNKLAPDLTRLNSLKRLSQMPSQNISSAVQAVILLPLFSWVVWTVAVSHIEEYAGLPRLPLERGIAVVATWLDGLLWKATGLLFLLGLIDLIRQRRKWMNQVRMSKQEIREEHKESEGSPLIKNRIRRLQREAARQKMIQQVPTATAVVVNPTHFAVALRYNMAEAGAPKVVAKGQKWLALRIREIAIRNQVPIIENPPLARALYASAQVGQEIPAHLYQAVAEVLAYIYRLMKGRLPG